LKEFIRPANLIKTKLAPLTHLLLLLLRHTHAHALACMQQLRPTQSNSRVPAPTAKAASGVAAEKGNLGIPRRQSHPDEPITDNEEPVPKPEAVPEEQEGGEAPPAGELKKRVGLTDSQESFFKRLDSNVDSALLPITEPNMAPFVEST
jgi:hypothetical protein